MKLEEAKERLKIIVETLKEYRDFHTVTDEEQQAIETALQALDNSIPKEKVINEIKKLNNIKIDGEVFITTVNFAKKTLQELLEEK